MYNEWFALLPYTSEPQLSWDSVTRQLAAAVILPCRDLTQICAWPVSDLSMWQL